MTRKEWLATEEGRHIPTRNPFVILRRWISEDQADFYPERTTEPKVWEEPQWPVL
jgi:hypothetical protein